MGQLRDRLLFGGLISSAYLSPILMIVSLATNYWIYSSEKAIPMMTTISNDFIDDVLTTRSPTEILPLDFIQGNYGLWMMCKIMDTSMRQDCEMIKNFQGSDSEIADSIKKQIDHCIIPIMISLCIMIISVILHSYALIKMKQHYLFLLSGCLVIFAGLSSLTGLIIYIAAVNGAVDNKIAKNNRIRGDEEPPFKYGYGISFYCAVLSFLTQEINGICNIYWYMSYHKKKRIKMKKFKLSKNRNDNNNNNNRSSSKQRNKSADTSILKNNNKIGNNIKIIITDESTTTVDNNNSNNQLQSINESQTESKQIKSSSPEPLTVVKQIEPQPLLLQPSPKQPSLSPPKTVDLNKIQIQSTNQIQQQYSSATTTTTTDSYNESCASTLSSNYASSSSTLKVMSDESNECYMFRENEILEENELKAKFYKLDSLENNNNNNKTNSKLFKCEFNNVRPIPLVKMTSSYIKPYSIGSASSYRSKTDINFNGSYFVKLPVYKLNTNGRGSTATRKNNIPFKLVSTATILKQQQNKHNHYQCHHPPHTFVTNSRAMINATNQAAVATENYLNSKLHFNNRSFHSNSYNYKTLPNLFLLNEASNSSSFFQCGVNSDLPINKMRSTNNAAKNSNKNHRVYRIRQRAPLLKQSSCNSTLKVTDTLTISNNNSYNLKFATSDFKLENNQNSNNSKNNNNNAHFHKLKRTTSV